MIVSGGVKVVCFGGATMDRQLRALVPLRADDSTPVVTRCTPGGVARNVAEALARLGCRSALVSIVGEDADGRAVIEGLELLGIDTSAMQRSAELATACYTAILEPSGALALGTIDAAIFAGLSAERLAELDLPAAEAWFVDANLETPSILALLGRPDRPGVVAADAVSATKVVRLRPVLDRLGLLFLNTLEAGALLGRAGAEPADLASALLATGVVRVVLNLGDRGAMVASGDELCHVPAVPARPLDVTGAGDTAAAATLAALLGGRSLLAAVLLGRAAAAMAIEHDRPVPENLSWAALEARAGS